VDDGNQPRSTLTVQLMPNLSVSQQASGADAVSKPIDRPGLLAAASTLMGR
jgi:hypothetical protein